MVRRLLFGFIQRWRGFVALMRHHRAQQKQMSRLCQHVRHREIAAAFNTWWHFTERSKVFERTALLSLKVHRRIAFQHWKRFFVHKARFSSGSMGPSSESLSLPHYLSFFAGVLFSLIILAFLDSVLLDSVKQLFYFGKNLT